MKYEVTLNIQQRYWHKVIVEADDEDSAAMKADSEFSSDQIDHDTELVSEYVEAEGVRLVKEPTP